MIDEHIVPNLEWGIKPILFHIGSFPIPSYSFFVGLAVIIGILFYWLEARKQKQLSENTLYILIGALIGGVIGAKLLVIIAYWSQLNLDIILTGKSIVGGLIGGTIGVMITKKILNIESQRKGNLFAPAIAIGVAIGRIGCFLRGCCFGKETTLPWGVNFGDGILRHPTQIYESIFMLGFFFYLLHAKTKNPKPGHLFNILIIGYFTFRFLIEFIRVEPIAFLGLTWFQILSLVAIIYTIWKK
jgi:phosphatidylglycerol:prolipoprotein diacylglycerol transferase